MSFFRYTLGDAGNRLRVIEQIERPNGSSEQRDISYTYDALYRLRNESVTMEFSSDSTSWTYDAVGNRLTESGFGSSGFINKSYTYNRNDWLLTETNNGVATVYAYDANGNTDSKLVGGVEQASYVYDSQDRMTVANITDQGATTTTFYDYDISGIGQRETVGGI